MSGQGPTEELAPQDAYLARAEGIVTEIADGGLFLDRTVFYAGGGGQPGDVGTISWDGGSAEVIDTVRKDRLPFHVLAKGSGSPIQAPRSRARSIGSGAT